MITTPGEQHKVVFALEKAYKNRKHEERINGVLRFLINNSSQNYGQLRPGLVVESKGKRAR